MGITGAIRGPLGFPAMSRVLVAACCCLLLTACVPPEEDNDRIVRYDPEKTIMGEIQARGTLRVGLPDGSDLEPAGHEGYCPFALEGPAGPEGFLVDLASLVADSLGVEAEFVSASSSELLALVHARGKGPESEVDLAFPMFPITEGLVQRRTFTDPYWVGHSRHLVSGEGKVLAEGPDVWLMRLACATGSGGVAGPENSTAGYGAAVRTGASTFANLVSQVLNEADAEGDWSRFYAKWLASLFEEPDPENVPTMSVEDAAALWPVGMGSPPTEGQLVGSARLAVTR